MNNKHEALFFDAERPGSPVRLRSRYYTQRTEDSLRIRLGLPIGCGLSYTDMLELDAVTSKALAVNT